ncbi:glycosyltransferase [Halorubrum tebenquichense]|uniref:Sugar transferase-like protein n=1 Tax=Halorubrum tebenquichense DSM 14210 TaxID=1227485 RepID=M0DV68_9EURY|nr:glycosyltransferase [Halorubrum tebenquichense]ELZ39420.1 sugar transferase-like protein [Halorubrum tebenquichense DSM 14210]
MRSNTTLSVIIPVYNDPGGIRDTLLSLTDQQNPPDYEIIVVDNDSTDETPTVIEEFEKNYPELVFGYSETEIQGSYAARNAGIEHASGDLLAFIDADVTVEDSWVADVHERFQNSDVDYLGCNVEMYIPEGEDTFWARYDVAMGLPVEHYLETKQFAPTCALVIRRDIVNDVGLFEESLTSGGDKEFGKRVHNAGFAMDYSGQLIARHPVRSTLREHVLKAKRIGTGQYQLWQQFDLALHPLCPLRLIPPNPVRIANRSKNSSRIWLVYIVAYFLKLVQMSSSIDSYLRN